MEKKAVHRSSPSDTVNVLTLILKRKGCPKLSLPRTRNIARWITLYDRPSVVEHIPWVVDVLAEKLNGQRFLD